MTLPEAWSYATSTVEPSSITMGGHTSSYQSVSQAAAWLQYHALHIMTSDLHLTLLRQAGQHFDDLPDHLSQIRSIRYDAGCLPDERQFSTREKDLEESIASTATTFSRTVLWFYDGHHHDCGDVSNLETNSEHSRLVLSPRMAVIIAWPIALAVRSTAIPSLHRSWLQERLDDVAEVTGAAVLRHTGGWRP
jgi:hypothetical protein